ncbi:hypothetical protein V7114_06915 [Neobacillus niacini]|uniref:hypothetical protein n=1 Tax=Neobacillus niacini TaxID=86668 RepID=UPI002FFFB989
MGQMSQEEINVDLFDEFKRLKKENELLINELKSIAKCLNEYFENEEDDTPSLDILSSIQEDVNELLEKL